MSATEQEKQRYGCHVQIVTRRDDCVVYRIFNETGNVLMTSYEVFPGIEIIYNDVHIEKCSMEHTMPGNIIEIDHCREGRIECGFQDEYLYLTQGDLAISRKEEFTHDSYFPLSHYHGITILIDIDKAPECLSCFLDDVDVRPHALIEKFCQNGKCFVARSKPCLEHIFSELYNVPESIKKGYFKVKILEILLVLSGMELGEDESKKRCVTKSQVLLAKRVCQCFTECMDSRITISELAEEFHVSQTTLKNSVKSVYGTSVYTFFRAQKMQAAALLLQQTELSVLEIAGRYGYDNGSKFAGAFRTIMGRTPNEYRSLARQENAVNTP